jgi:3-hydroxy-9,10-secoandrosta-1,3,5(10)-triene-9,17-dione monooxygenase reductase component
VTVVTTTHAGTRYGMTASAVASVSLEPPLLLVCMNRDSPTHEAVRETGRFAVNVLAGDQEEISNQMATRGIDKFEGIEWEPAPETGSPLLAGALAHLDCTIHAVYEAGDHYVVLGRVKYLTAESRSCDTVSPLLYFEGRYRTTD